LQIQDNLLREIKDVNIVFRVRTNQSLNVIQPFRLLLLSVLSSILDLTEHHIGSVFLKVVIF